MSHLKSFGFNQKNFNGTRPVTNAAINLGTTRGKGSSTRMFNYCTQHSEAPSLCINSFISATPATPAVNDILFNISTFSNLFNYDDSGTPKKLPSKYINGLISAVNRWNQFIKFNQDTINLIRTISINTQYKNWNGIELKNVTYIDNPSLGASVITTLVAYTTLNVSFTLQINNNTMSTTADSTISDIFTHELGHVLGFSRWPSHVDGKPDGANVLQLVTNVKFHFDPLCTIDPPYKNMNKGYNNYWGTIDYLNRKVEAQTTPIINNSDGTHFGGYFISKEPPPDPTSDKGGKYLKRGIGNDVMVPQFSQYNKYYISQVSLGYLLDLFTNWKGRNYFNYTVKNANSEANPAVPGSFNLPQSDGWGANAYIWFNKFKQNKSINLNSNDTKEKGVEEVQTITFNCSCDCSPIIIPLEL